MYNQFYYNRFVTQNKCISIVQRRRRKTHLADRTQFYPLRVGTSRYGPPSGIYNTHAPLCVLCLLFLEGYEANMSINSKRRCVVVLMSCDTWTNHDHRSERFQKSLVMVCIASMEWWKGKSFILPQWLTLLWKNLTAAWWSHSIAPQNLIRRPSNMFPGRWSGKNLNVCTITPGKFKWKHSIHASRAACGLWL